MAGQQGIDRDGDGQTRQQEAQVDLVLPPGEMPERLVNLARNPYVRQLAETVDEGAPEEQLHGLLELVRARTRRDFSSYKKRTLRRRIQRRMSLHRIEGLPGYIERLRTRTRSRRWLRT